MLKDMTPEDEREKKWFSTILESANIGIWDYNLKTGETYYSPQYYRMLEYEPYEIPPSMDLWLEHLHPSYREELSLKIADFIRQNTDYFEDDYLMRAKSGNWRWILSRARVLERDENDAPERIVGIHLDITDRKQAETELQENRERNQILVNALPDLIFRLDRNNRFLDVASPGRDDLFIPESQIRGRYLNEIIPPDVFDRLSRKIREAFETGEIKICEYQLQIRQEEKHFEARIAPIGNSEYLALIRNISDRKNMEKTLKELAAFFINDPAPVLRADDSGNITHSNPSANRVFSRDLAGDSVYTLFENMDKSELLELEPDSPIQREKQIGNNVFLFTIIRDRLSGYINIYGSDITARKRLEQDLLMKNTELNDFTYRVSHDLKTPVSLIRLYIDMIGKRPELTEDNLVRISQITDQLSEQIDNLLKLSRAGKTIDRKEHTEISMLIKYAYSFFQKQTKDMRLHIAPDLPSFLCDRSAMTDVFTNLIQNSIKYRDPDKKWLILKAGSYIDGDKRIIFMKDNGSGIEEKNLEKIFAPGFVLERNRGTGFGLAITRKIITAHGGRIWAESEGLKKGTTFHIYLP